MLPLRLHILSTSRITESLSYSWSSPEPKENRHSASRPFLVKCQQYNFPIPYEEAKGNTKSRKKKYLNAGLCK